MLSGFYAILALACLLSLAPGWLVGDRLGAVVVALVATVGALLLRIFGAHWSGVVEHLCVAALSVAVAGVAYSAGGGTTTFAFSMLALLPVLYAALHFNGAAVAVHTLAGLLLVGVAISVTDPGNRANGHYLVLGGLTLFAAVTVVNRLLQRIRKAVVTDALTGLLNEQGLMQRMQAPREGQRTLVLMDVDDLERVNRTAGRAIGDLLLRQAAQRLQHHPTARSVWARVDGDAFATVAFSGDPYGGAAPEELAAQLRAEAEGTYQLGDLQVDVTFTVATVHDEGTCPTPELLRRANTALGAARDEAVRHKPWVAGLERDHRDDLRTLVELRAAISNDELLLHYQPKVDATTHQIAGVEALVRWQHPARGLLPPAAFVDLAENGPLIREMTLTVLDEAARQASSWRRAGLYWPVAVNLSPRLLGSTDIIDDVIGIAARHDLPPRWLTLEVTETALTAQPVRAAQTLGVLRQSGFRIALDDYGTGYTNLAMLSDLPLDELKLDRRFVAAALDRPRDRALVDSVAALARILNLDSVAEGVEDAGTADLVRTSGFDSIQGYYFSRPLPAPELTRRWSAPSHLDATPRPAQDPAAAADEFVGRSCSGTRAAR